MALSTETGFFGAIGVDDPVCTFPEVTIGRTVDFAKTNVDENKNYPILPIPAGFVITDIAVKQLEAADQDATIKFKVKSDEKQLGADIALKDLSSSAESLARYCGSAVNTAEGSTLYAATSSAGSPTQSFKVPATASGYFASAADMLCLCTPSSLTGDKLTKGKVAVYLRGFQAFAEGTVSAPAGTEAYRGMLQTQDNVSGGPINPRTPA